jgi:hypothetical protein
VSDFVQSPGDLCFNVFKVFKREAEDGGSVDGVAKLQNNIIQAVDLATPQACSCPTRRDKPSCLYPTIDAGTLPS